MPTLLEISNPNRPPEKVHEDIFTIWIHIYLNCFEEESNPVTFVGTVI